jgi:uncharacterized membrane protein YtjA (UPF0391 family)
MNRSLLLLLSAVVAGLFAFGRLTADTYAEGTARVFFYLLGGAFVVSLCCGLSSRPDRRR